MWAFNIFLYLMWAFNPPVYQGMVANGAACVYNQPIGGVYATGPAPACWYDPSNTNVYDGSGN